MKKDSKEAEDSGVDPYAAKYGDPFGVMQSQKDQMDMQTDQMKQQAEQPPEGEPSAEGQPPAEQPAPEQPQVDMQELQKKINATGIPSAEFLKLTPEQLKELGFTEDEINVIAQQAQQQQQMAAHYVKTKNGLYEQKFYEAIKKKPLHEAMEEVINEEVQTYRMMEDKEEFKYMDRHFVMSSFHSSERNNSGVIELNENNEVFKAKSHQENKSIKIKGIDILEDTVQDQRYNRKPRKEKLKEKSLL